MTDEEKTKVDFLLSVEEMKARCFRIVSTAAAAAVVQAQNSQRGARKEERERFAAKLSRLAAEILAL